MTENEIKEAKAAKAAYMRRWVKENREKKRAADLRYWLKVSRAENATADREETTPDEEH